MNAADLSRLLGPLSRRIRMVAARAVLRLIDDGMQAQACQVDLLAGESAEGVERFQEYGFTSVPHPGAEAAVLFIGGARSHGVIVAVEDRRYRLRGLQGGEVALYDDLGNVVKLGRDALTVTGHAKVHVVAPVVLVECDDVRLGGEGGAAVARVGDSVAGGVITSGSAKVTAA